MPGKKAVKMKAGPPRGQSPQDRIRTALMEAQSRMFIPQLVTISKEMTPTMHVTDYMNMVLQKCHQHPETILDAIIQRYVQAFGPITPGRIVRIKDAARYNITTPGSLGFCFKVDIDGPMLTDPDYRADAYIFPLAGDLPTAEDFRIKADDLETIDPKEELRILNSWSNPVSELPPLSDGDPVELVEDMFLEFRSFFGTKLRRLPKGLKGVIDIPDQVAGMDRHHANAQQRREKTRKVTCGFYNNFRCDDCGHRIGERSAEWVFEQRLELPVSNAGVSHQVYVPKMHGHVDIPRNQLKLRDFNDKALDGVVMDEEAKLELLATLEGTDTEAFGIESIAKGQGTIILAYGSPGTGKTLSAEAIAEHLHKPLYIIDNAELKQDPDEFESNLDQIMTRAKRWQAVVLMDEAETWLRERNDDTEHNSRVATLLRHMEEYTGVLFLTTNKAVDLDFAFDSRIHLKLRYPDFDTSMRRDVWDITLPEQMVCDDLDLEQLAAIPLNGREIKTAIINAARTAAYRKTEMSQDILVKAANRLVETNTEFRKTPGLRRDGKGNGTSTQALVHVPAEA